MMQAKKQEQNIQKQQQQQRQQQQASLKEEAARAVVREAALRGYQCVELGHDGRRPIFFCIYCGTRCYTDVSLWDHLKGNVHARRTSAADPMCLDSKPALLGGSSALVDVKMKDSKPPQVKMITALPVSPPQLQLKLVDQGQVFLKVRPCSKLVEACWFEKRPLQHPQQQATDTVYAIVVFPYSEGLGRTGIQLRSEKAAPSTAIVEHKGTGRGKKRSKPVDRICFICRQRIVPGKEVATLLNVNNKQTMMMCHSRNLRGAFHVYHTCCLVNWILIFNAKQWMGQSLTFRRQFRNSLDGNSSKPIFCPECQGTGVRPTEGQLERPRYRLAQIFEWVLQLVQARKLWSDQLGQETSGLMFHASKGICHPRDFESSLVIPLGMLRLYSSAEPRVHSSLKPEKMELDVPTNMDCA